MAKKLKKVKRVVSEKKREAARRNIKLALAASQKKKLEDPDGYARERNECLRKARKKYAENKKNKEEKIPIPCNASDSTVWARIQEANILQFAKIMGFSFDGRPGQELTLRLLHGLGLPSGTVKTFVRIPCDGFVLEEKEMTWMEYYTLLTGNQTLFEPNGEPTEAYLCVGARAGKSTITALETTFQATRDKWKQYLRSSSERAYACVIATNLDQARDIIQGMASDMILNSPLSDFLDGEIVKREIKFTNGLGIRSWPCNARAPRGYPYFFTAYDEPAWYFTEGAKSDENIHAAVNPRRMQFPLSKHMEISTPAGKQGRFYEQHSKGARVHRRLTICAPTWTFRPELHRLDPEFFGIQYNENPFHANREYGAEFDETVEPFLPEQETKEALTLPGDIPPNAAFQYMAGADASGLTSNDRFGFAICGRDLDRDKYIVPIVRSWAETNPHPIMEEIRRICQAFGINKVWGDAYAKGWVSSAFRQIGLEFVVCPNSAIVWSNGRRLILGRNIEMPMNDGLRSGLLKTQGSYTASNKITITHPRDKYGHADEAEAVMKAAYGASDESHWSSKPTAEQQRAAREAQRAEEEYDPLSYGRT